MSSHCMESFKQMSAPYVHPIFVILAHVDTGAPSAPQFLLSRGPSSLKLFKGRLRKEARETT